MLEYIVNNLKPTTRQLDMAFMYAAENEYVTTLKYLRNSGATNVNRALSAAAFKDSIYAVKYLVEEEGADNLDYSLIQAACNGNLKIIKYLVSQGADPHANYDNALHVAENGDHAATIQYLEEV